MHSEVDCDVLVIGGGPGGTTAATLLSRKGWKVLLLEKDSHPRFHIGESLLPCNVPIFDELGVLDKVRDLGVLKLGADFPSGDGNYQTIYFRRALGTSSPHAWHVRRDEFDQMLFEHARANGVDARERVKVISTEVSGIDSAPMRIASATCALFGPNNACMRGSACACRLAASSARSNEYNNSL